MGHWSSRGRSESLPPTAGSCRCPPGRTADRRKSLSCAVVAGQRPNPFVTELTSATASRTPHPLPPLPRLKHGVLCCHRPGRGGTGEPSRQRVKHTPLPMPPNGGTRNGEGWKSPDGGG